jgi:hypothetical protein
MNLTQWQTKPSWGEYEAQLLGRGFEPYWDPETEQRISGAGITCCRCGTTLTYIGMTDGKTEFGFLTGGRHLFQPSRMVPPCSMCPQRVPLRWARVRDVVGGCLRPRARDGIGSPGAGERPPSLQQLGSSMAYPRSPLPSSASSAGRRRRRVRWA